MSAKLLEGKVLASKIQEEIKKTLEELNAKSLVRPAMVALQAGNHPSSDWYVGQQEKLAAKLGLGFQKYPCPGLQKRHTGCRSNCTAGCNRKAL